MLDTCPYCYTRVSNKDVYCPSCGNKLKQPKAKKAPTQTRYEPPPMKPAYAVPRTEPPRQDYYHPSEQPTYRSHPARRDIPPQVPPNMMIPAKCEDRCIAYCIDEAIAYGINSFTCCLGCLYTYFRDGYNYGKGFGKGAMHIRVINYNTGMPATYGESCIRNFCNCCPPTIICNSEYRHMGDLIAGTMVIEDR
ncbi:MAG: hypothetical protein ACXAEU_08140 [Candidatus Hodarchaeales archaeon]